MSTLFPTKGGRLPRHGPVRKRKVSILLFDEVEVLDFAGPFEVFSVTAELGGDDLFEVVTVAEDTSPVRAVGGLKVLPGQTLADSRRPDVLVVPGGAGSLREAENTRIVEWVRGVHDAAEIVMSVCSGARILAKAGLLNGLRVTTHHQVIDHLRQLAPLAEVDPDPRIIDSGKIITTGGISAGIDGALYVVARLHGTTTAKNTAAYMEYDWLSHEEEGGTGG